MSTQRLVAGNPGLEDANAAEEGERSGGVQYEPLGLARSVLVIVYVAVAIWYLAWRPSTFNPNAPFFSALLYAGELFGFVTSLMHIFLTWRLTIREPLVAPIGLAVDVFITTYNEPVAMLRRTLLAAMHMDYEHQTWLLDDGNRPEMRALAEELGCRYLAREKNIDAKAGNLNNGLAHSRAEFIAVFDADHAPARDFLRRTLGYFRDADVAFVQTPQDFYNLDSYQHRRNRNRRLVWSEQSLFFRVIQRGKDYWNAAFFCGSCAVLRRRALDDVKGFATGTVTEDLQTSIRMHAKRFKSIYHSESLAFGVAPATVVPFLKQRVRWGMGAMQALRGGSILFGGGLSLPQRISYMATVLTYFDGWQKAIFYFAPVVVLVTGVMPVAEMSWAFLFHFVPFYILTFWVFEEVGRGFGRSVNTEQYNMARFAAFVWSTTGMVRGKLRFGVTPKQRSASDESRHWVYPQGVILLLNFIAIPIGIMFTWARGDLPTGALIANVIWAVVNLSLARAVLGFTARLASFQRREYRFPIPLPALLDFPGDSVNGVLDDVSSQGFKFYGRFPKRVTQGTRISGELYLPAGKLGFKAEVRALIHADHAQRHVKAVGCSFEWERETDRDELDGFLYGSNLQWRMNHLGEQVRTPLEWFAEVLGVRPRQVSVEPEHWASVLTRPVASPQSVVQVGLVSIPTGPSAERTLITFRQLRTTEPLHMVVITRAGEHALNGDCEFIEAIDSAASPVYRYRFRISDQRERGWDTRA